MIATRALQAIYFTVHTLNTILFYIEVRMYKLQKVYSTYKTRIHWLMGITSPWWVAHLWNECKISILCVPITMMFIAYVQLYKYI